MTPMADLPGIGADIVATSPYKYFGPHQGMLGVRAEVLAALEGAKGFLRREIAARVQLRHAPQFVFHWDRAPDHAARAALCTAARRPPQ